MAGQDPSSGVARGMRALLARRDAELAAGARPIGWKIGFNTPAIQEHFGLTEPVVGYLTDAGLTADGATVSLNGWRAPAVEVEVAIRVGTDIGVGGLSPALELVDLGVPFDDIEVVLADNICQRGVVVGTEVPGVDPWEIACVVTKSDHGGAAVVAEGAIAEDPADTVTFVRGYLETHGASIVEGDAIIAGSMIAPLPVAPGEELAITFGPLGELRVSFGD
jgi:2-oxo-hept-3-ene-1,7-dioate hydratase